MSRRAGRGTGAFGVGAGLLLLVLVWAGCDGGDEEGREGPELSRSEFAEIVGEIREAERALADSMRTDSALADSAVAAARFEERKREILSRHGVEESTLRDYLRAYRTDLNAIQATWDTLSERLHPEPPDSIEEE